MNKRQIAQALTAHKEREAAKRAERLVVPGYPYSHNPYLKHTPVEDCFSGCIHEDPDEVLWAGDAYYFVPKEPTR